MKEMQDKLNKLLPSDMTKGSIKVADLRRGSLVVWCEWSYSVGCALELPEEITSLDAEFAGRNVLGVVEGAPAGPLVDSFTLRLEIEGSFDLASSLQQHINDHSHEAKHSHCSLQRKSLGSNRVQSEGHRDQRTDPQDKTSREQRLPRDASHLGCEGTGFHLLSSKIYAQVPALMKLRPLLRPPRHLRTFNELATVLSLCRRFCSRSNQLTMNAGSYPAAMHTAVERRALELAPSVPLMPTEEEPTEHFMLCELHVDDLVRTIMRCTSVSCEGCDRLERAQFKLHELLDSPEKHLEKYLTGLDMSRFLFWRNGALALAARQSNPSRDELQRCAVQYAVYLFLHDQELESRRELVDHHAASSFRPVKPEDVTLLQQRTRYRIHFAAAADDADLLHDKKRRQRKSELEQQLRIRLLPELQQSIRVVNLTHSPLVMACEWSRPAGCTLELPEEISNNCGDLAGRRVLGMEGSRPGPRVDGFTFRLKIVGSLALGSHLQRLNIGPAHEAHYKNKQLLDKHIDFRPAREEPNPQQGLLPSLAAQREQRLQEPAYIDQTFEGNKAIYANGCAFSTRDGTERSKAIGPVIFLPPEHGVTSDTIPPVAKHANAGQRNIGNCWLVSALLLIDHLKHRVISGGSDGKWSVNLCRDGEWLVVTVDGRLPFMMHGTKAELTPAFAHGDFWVSLVEKAFAKMYMNCESLESGSTDEALETLTGFPTTRMKLQGLHLSRDKALRDKLWEELVSALRAGFLCTATVDGSNTVKAEKMRLVPEHAYSLIGVDEGKRHVLLLNPL
ncbi:MAG: hypothetical protein SGPRY_014360, partial [Prymnesium sp.]